MESGEGQANRLNRIAKYFLVTEKYPVETLEYELDICAKALGDLYASVRHVWDMLRPHYESQCKTISGIWHRHPDED
ncbi:Ubiquitin carboxyl-terminal hydrolase 2 [Gossypium arboreum]|uniref:Ubiquitin carboxyl-terminal hydrolase 2 n=1 Tax=Gossypium arboreum TaxID=29729 RepID=A0A0B0N028_GOSAR|nr:Ubiquitin carboxyl-terminal hydrolase 2 [Gossypium arboreum]